jgi:hypothetical protein
MGRSNQTGETPMEDNRSSNGRKRRGTVLVLLLAVATLTAACVAGAVILGRGVSATTASLSGTNLDFTAAGGEENALSVEVVGTRFRVIDNTAPVTAGAGDSQPTGGGPDSGQEPAGPGGPSAGKPPDPQQPGDPGNPGNPGNPGKPVKLPHVDEVPFPIQPLPTGLPKPPFPKPTVPPWHIVHP